jgi:hypothetical protein
VDALAELRQLAPPGPRPPAPDPWASPRRLPPDFMAVAIEWGPGRFGGFLWLLVPGAADRNLALEHHANTQLRALRELEGTSPAARASSRRRDPAAVVARVRGPQPHVRMRDIAIRHWDGYWFGRET